MTPPTRRHPPTTAAAKPPRVAVLTFHFHYNYGGVLQAYGLAQALRQLGCEAIFPATIPRYCRGWIGTRELLAIRKKGVVRAMAEARRELSRRHAFDLFRRRHFPAAVGGPAWKDVIADPGVRAVVVGSDQVWNLAWMRNWEPYYFLGSLPADSPIRRIAYAACFGTENQRPEYLERAGPLLEKFDAIGVRTGTTRRIVEENFGLRTTRVVDPSLLHDFRDLGGMRPYDGPYILHYGIRPEAIERGRDIAVALRRRTGLPIALIVPESYALESWPHTGWADRVLGEASPADWVESIRGCSYLVTDSFHGCVFASRARRPFLAFAQGRSAERILDVTRHYGLEDRMAPDGDAADAVDAMLAPVDFAAVHDRLALDREASLRFLREALAGIAPGAADSTT